MSDTLAICKLGNKSQGMGDATAISVTANISLIFIIVENNFLYFFGGMLF